MKKSLLLMACVVLLMGCCIAQNVALAGNWDQTGEIKYESWLKGSEGPWVYSVNHNNVMAWSLKNRTQVYYAQVKLNAMYRDDIKKDAPTGKKYYCWADVYKDLYPTTNPRQAFTRVSSKAGNDNLVYNNGTFASVPYADGAGIAGRFSLVMRLAEDYATYGKIRLRGYYNP